jgi:hypothetical protein
MGETPNEQIIIDATPKRFVVSSSVDEEYLDRLGAGSADILPDYSDSDGDGEEIGEND